ncbi:restriction endonuclease [Planctomonas deserti]|uniref:restriction endonuclease n=1 Tax=Planctomonas deserti TaxID=2144185 RepID=UPI00131F3B72|nr:restriction endonuclease [Planctomonas deserti]
MYDPHRPWERINGAVLQATMVADTQDADDLVFTYPEWAWLNDPLPHNIEVEIVGTAAAFGWKESDVRFDSRRLYYEALRKRLADYSALHHGQHFTFPLDPAPITSLPVQPALSYAQMGFLHAVGQVVGDSRVISEAHQYNWINVLDYGGWIVADPRHLEGEIQELESRHKSFITATRKQMLRAERTATVMATLEHGARLALYHAYWYRLNARRNQLIVAGLRGRSRVRASRPSPQPYGVSHEGAELLCAGWLSHLGGTNVSITTFSGDGGIDVVSDTAIAQVKNYSGTVGVEEVRAFHGVASVDGRIGLFFTSGTYTSGATDFANRAQMALFEYDAIAGSLTGANAMGRTVLLMGV